MARLALRGRGGAPLAPLMLGFPPSAERLVYEVRQKCRNIEGESSGTVTPTPRDGQVGWLPVGSLGQRHGSRERFE